MKSKSMILMVVAMACGLVAAYTTAKLTAKSDGETEKVLVAAQEIKIGTVMKEPEKLFVEVDQRKGMSPNAVTDLEQMKDKVLIKTVRKGQFIVNEDLSTNFGITPPKGTKAMAIKVTADTAVAGFIMPGSRVDVIATIGGNNQGSKPEVQTILQNQEVLAVDRISVRPDGQSAVETIGTVTLAVTPQNAQKLELALNLSNNHVRLLLRDQNDTATARVNPIKSLTESTGEFGGDASQQPVKALVAKDDLKPGTKIDEPEKYFHAVLSQNVPDRGYQEADLNRLKGLTIHVPLFKDGFVTVKHFEEQKSEKPAEKVASATPTKPVPAPPEPTRHVLFIQNGKQETQVVHYQDGVQVTGDSSKSPLPPAPTPKPQPEPKAETKAEEKPAEETPAEEKPADAPKSESGN